MHIDRMMRELSNHKWFYRSTISDCCDSLCSLHGVEATPDDKTSIISRVTAAFESLGYTVKP